VADDERPAPGGVGDLVMGRESDPDRGNSAALFTAPVPLSDDPESAVVFGPIRGGIE